MFQQVSSIEMISEALRIDDPAQRVKDDWEEEVSDTKGEAQGISISSSCKGISYQLELQQGHRDNEVRLDWDEK